MIDLAKLVLTIVQPVFELSSYFFTPVQTVEATLSRPSTRTTLCVWDILSSPL